MAQQAAARSAGITTTTRLLACGVLAGPLYVAVVVGQALTRDGFDPRRHPASLLSNGAPGWVQITNFVVTGLLVVACAAGLHRALRTGRGATWGPRLLAVYGVSLVAAGAFVADPMDGFPAGAPPGPPAAVSWHGLAHLASGAVGFAAFVAACFVFARRFAARGRRGWAAYSAATGALFGGAFLGIASGGGAPALTVAFAVAVLLGWAWLAALAAHTVHEEVS